MLVKSIRCINEPSSFLMHFALMQSGQQIDANEHRSVS